MSDSSSPQASEEAFAVSLEAEESAPIQRTFSWRETRQTIHSAFQRCIPTDAFVQELMGYSCAMLLTAFAMYVWEQGVVGFYYGTIAQFIIAHLQ